MKYAWLPLLVFTFSASKSEFNASFGDFVQSFGDIVKSVTGEAAKIVPKPDDFFEELKNVVAGYPVEPAIIFLNTLCSVVLSEKNVKPREKITIDKINYVFKSKDKNISVPVNDPLKLLSLEEFNREWPLILMVTGWTTNISEQSAADPIFDAYQCRGNFNFVVLDTADFIDTLYSWSAFNTEEIGEILGDSLATLIQSFPLDNIQLIGHSLGAQICGSAGRHFYNQTKQLLPKIIGLDPANLCFGMGETLTGLFRGDAEFVMIIHSNPGIFGKPDPLGDVDFYPNGLRPLQAGCITISCAHARAYEYYSESVYPGNEYNFMAVKCTSLSALEAGFCTDTPIPMGYMTPTNAKGNYFLETNSKSPYGQNATKNFTPGCHSISQNNNTSDLKINE